MTNIIQPPDDDEKVRKYPLCKRCQRWIEYQIHQRRETI
jgi:hypothetical protein